MFNPTLASLKARAKKTDSLLVRFIKSTTRNINVLNAGIELTVKERDRLARERDEACDLKTANSKLL